MTALAEAMGDLCRASEESTQALRTMSTILLQHTSIAYVDTLSEGLELELGGVSEQQDF